MHLLICSKAVEFVVICLMLALGIASFGVLLKALNFTAHVWQSLI